MRGSLTRRYTILYIFTISALTTSAFAQLTEREKQLIAPSLSVSPGLDYILEINLETLGSSDNLPFWMYHNSRGRVSKTSNLAAWFSGKTVMFLTEKSFLMAGTTVLYQDGIHEGIVPDELFVYYQNPIIYAIAGRKQREDLYNGLSATNENMLWSLNARPLPGLQIGTNGPLLLFGSWGPGVELSWNEYFLGKDRKIKDAKLHHKSLYFIYRSRNGVQIKAGAQHFAHWNGKYADGSDLPEDVGNYFEAITLKNNSNTHMTTYEINLDKEFRDFSLRLIYNHLATDRSGRLYENSPDGRYGVFFKQKEQDRLINAVNYEFYYTKDQSFSPDGNFTDNYFNYYLYAEGWSYKDRFLGVPFFTYHSEGKRVINNKFIAHHIGISGQLNIPFETNPYKLLISYVWEYGTYPNPFEPPQNAFYTYFEIGLLENPANIRLNMATESRSGSPLSLGAGLHINYRF